MERILRLRSLGLLALATLAAACGSTVSVGNDNPTGTVGGIVIDAANEMPLAGVAVKIVSGSSAISATTDMNGVWQATGVPAGSFILNLQQMGYVPTTFNATLNGAVGNLPVHNPALTLGPLGLLKSTGAFDVRIVDQGGAPVGGVNVVARPQVRYVDFSTGQPIAVGSYLVSAASDAMGVVHLTGLPDYAGLGSAISDQLPIDVPATRVMGTEGYSFLGGTFSFSVNHLVDSTPTITLAGPRTTLAVVNSNVDYIRTGQIGPTQSVIPTTGPITVAFNQAINASSVRASFFAEDGKPSTIVAMPTVATNLLTITPSTAFPPGQRFNLQLHVVAAASLLSGNELDLSAPFFIEPNMNPTTITNGNLAPRIDNNLPPSTLVFTLSEAIGQGRGLAGSIDCVAFYEGALFNNDASTPFPGDYNNGSPTDLVCTAPPAQQPALNVTRIRPVGENGAFPVTGFSTTWAVQYDAPGTGGGCSATLGMVSCTRPKSGTKIHLVFSKLDPGSTVRRVNGQAVDDKIVVVIP